MLENDVQSRRCDLSAIGKTFHSWIGFTNTHCVSVCLYMHIFIIYVYVNYMPMNFTSKAWQQVNYLGKQILLTCERVHTVNLFICGERVKTRKQWIPLKYINRTVFILSQFSILQYIQKSIHDIVLSSILSLLAANGYMPKAIGNFKMPSFHGLNTIVPLLFRFIGKFVFKSVP